MRDPEKGEQEVGEDVRKRRRAVVEAVGKAVAVGGGKG